MVTDATVGTFDQVVLARSRELPVVVDFWASWCGPCRVLGPVLERAVAATAGAVELVKVDVDAAPELGQRYGVRGIPAVKAFRDGQVVAEFVGAQPAPAVTAFLDRLRPSPAQALAAAGDEPSLRAALEADPSYLPARQRLVALLIQRQAFAEALEATRGAPHDRICDGYAAWATLALEHGTDPVVAPLLERLTAGGWAAALEVAVATVGGAAGPVRDLARRVAVGCLELLGPDDPQTARGRQALAAALY